MSINRSISMAKDAPDEILIKAVKDPTASHIPQPIAYQELINRQRMRLAQRGGLGFATGGDVKGYRVGSPDGVALDPEWQTVTDSLEGTGGDYNHGGPKKTGVRGRYQYSPRTYRRIAMQLGLDPNKWDKATQDAVHAEYTRQNQQALAAAGVPINNTTSYLGHFLDGPVAAKFYKIVQSNPGMDPKEALMRAGYPEQQAQNTIDWNPRWFSKARTASEVVERIDHAATRAVQRARAAAQGVGAQVKDAAGNLVGDTVDAAAPYIGPAQQYVQGAGNILQGVGNAATNVGNAAIDTGADIYGGVAPFIKSPRDKTPPPMAQIDPASLNKTGWDMNPHPLVSAPPVAIPTAADIGAPPPAQTGVFPRTFGPKEPEQHGFAWDQFGGALDSNPGQFLGFEYGPNRPPEPYDAGVQRTNPDNPRYYDEFIRDTLARRKYLGDALNPFHTNHNMDITDKDPGTTQVVKGFGQLGEQIVKGAAAPLHAAAYLGNEALGLGVRGGMNVRDWLLYSPEERKRLTSNGLWGEGQSSSPQDDAAVKKLADISPDALNATGKDLRKEFTPAPSPVAALKPRPEAEAAAAQDPQLAAFYNDLKESKADLARQGDNNRAMSLLMAGLGIAGGKSQYFAENLAGAIPAIQNYQQGEREINMARHDLAKEGIAQRQMDRQISQQDVNVQLARDKMAMEKENQTRDNRTALLNEYYRPMSADDLDRAARTRSADGTTTYDNAIADLQSLDALRRQQALKLVEAQMAASTQQPQVPAQLPLQGSANQPYVLTPPK